MGKTNEKKTLWDAYAFSTSYIGFTTLIGQPAERIKVALQTNLQHSAYSVTKQFVGGSLNHFFTGFWSCMLRQQSKVLYRPLLITYMPDKIDRLEFPPLIGSVLKAAAASVSDTLIVSPLENIKTVQMKALASKDKPVKPAEALRTIYNTRGLPGFFVGSPATLSKAFPTWLYLFITYNAIKTKREQQNFLSTILWATVASAPVAVATTPLDVIKSQQQACNDAIQKGLKETASQIYKNHGVSAFFRGFSCRLLHKSLSTAGAYIMFDMAKKM